MNFEVFILIRFNLIGLLFFIYGGIIKLVIAQSNLTLMGGAEMVVLKIAQKYNPIIYTAEYDLKKTYKEFKDFDIRIISQGFLTKVMPYSRVSQGLDYGLSFYNMKIKEDYDVINAHLAPSHWIRNNNERVLWYCHTPLRDIYDLYEYRMSLRKPHQRPLYKLGARLVKRFDQDAVRKIESIVANSENTKSRVQKYYGRNAMVLNGGIDYKLYRNNGDGKYFLYPSRFSPNKRQDYVVRAFGMFKKKRKGYKLILCGALSNDKFYQDYYENVAKLASEVGDIEIIPNIGDKRLMGLFSKATAVLYAPVNEDYGLTPIQAMASRKPIISVNEGGPKDTIVNDVTGFLVNSEREMAEMMFVVASNESLAESIGKRGLDRVRRHYTWDIFFKKFDNELKRVSKMS